MIDERNEELIPVGNPKRLPGRPSRTSVWRYCTVGLRSPITGEIVKLETRRVGGRVYTTVDAFKRFNDELNGEGGSNFVFLDI